MEVIKITPRGYCYGVVDAIQMAKQVAQEPAYPRPIHILGLIVHNRHVVESLEKEYGIISLDGPDRLSLLDQITEGTVIFTAHGVSPAVKAKAKEKGLVCIDATCPDVTRTHELIRESGRERIPDHLHRQNGVTPSPKGRWERRPVSVHLVENRGRRRRLRAWRRAGRGDDPDHAQPVGHRGADRIHPLPLSQRPGLQRDLLRHAVPPRGRGHPSERSRLGAGRRRRAQQQLQSLGPGRARSGRAARHTSSTA